MCEKFPAKLKETELKWIITRCCLKGKTDVFPSTKLYMLFFFFAKIKGSNSRCTMATYNCTQYAKDGLVLILYGKFHRSTDSAKCSKCTNTFIEFRQKTQHYVSLPHKMCFCCCFCGGSQTSAKYILNLKCR